MSHQFPPDVEQFVKHELALGNYHSEDELIADAVRLLQGDREQQQDDLRAVRAGVEALQGGDEGIPLDEAFDTRRK
jgi:putative addiction module CopG family antidote